MQTLVVMLELTARILLYSLQTLSYFKLFIGFLEYKIIIYIKGVTQESIALKTNTAYIAHITTGRMR